AATPRVVSGECVAHPFSRNIVHLTQAEHIELKWQGNYWKRQHGYLKKQNQELKQELDLAHGKIRDLKQRLYGKKSEKGTTKRDSPATDGNKVCSSRPRGQQKGSKGHGRTSRPDLAVIEEEQDVAPEDQNCCICGKAYKPLSQTEDSRITEVHVKAHIRLIHRKMYAQACECEGVPGIITAPPAARLIAKTSVGISVWTEVLINKFLFSRATYNLCTDYAYRGLALAPGTLTGGLKRITPLFNPLIAKLVEKQLTEALFHNDETGWKVFEAIAGKASYRWWLWVTQSPSVVYYTLAPSRSGDIPINHFSGLDKDLEQVIVVCDRYSGYKRLARENAVILLAFCWAHVRRDFLDAARSWPDLQGWMLCWVDRIGELYHLNAQRLEQWDQSQALVGQTPAFMERHQALEHAVERMAVQCNTELEQEQLHFAQRDVLNSLNNHWLGLTVFVQCPQAPLDNNTAERRMRNPGMGRKNYYGSGSQWSAGLAAMIFSLFQTVLLWQLNPHHWLHSYLTACADHGGQAPVDLSPFIPWQMSEQRKQQLAKPLPP
ncbi:IS66 family transposase, partial [Gammaproteobacteria bacterium]|nr:IS66 family transposase [Gammaproteobacteria bacterium]